MITTLRLPCSLAHPTHPPTHTSSGFILSAKLSVLCVPLGLAASVALTSSGFLLQTRGLKAGNTVVVCVAAAVSSMISGVAAGGWGDEGERVKRGGAH